VFGNILGGKYEQTWAYGETGNHAAITLDGATLSFAHDETASDKGGLANEITGVNGDDGDIAHDPAGNMSKVPLAKDGEIIGHRVHTYDAWNRLVKIETDAATSPDTIAVMKYDGLGRRIYKAITNSGKLNGMYKFFYDGQAPAGQAKLIETHNGSDQVIKHNVWGPTYVDELVQVAANSNPSVDGDMDVFRVILDDANFNIIGIMNDSHDLIERREYHAYGKRQVFVQRDSEDAQCTAEIPHPKAVEISGTPQAYAICEEGYQGLMYDKEFELYNNKSRYLDPTLCRFISRDPLKYVDGSVMYASRADGPDKLDPTGMEYIKTNGSDVWWIIEEDGYVYDKDIKWVWLGKLRGSEVEIQIGFAKGKHFPTPKSNYRVSMSALKLQAKNWWEMAPSLHDLPSGTQEQYIAGAISSAYDGVRPALAPSALAQVGDVIGTSLDVSGKAIVNSGGKAVVSTGSLGLYEAGDIIEVTARDLDYGYDVSAGIARVTSEGVLGVGIGGLSGISKGGKVLQTIAKTALYMDRAQAVVDVTMGGYIAASTGGADGKLQLLSGLVGGGSNLIAARKAAAARRAAEAAAQASAARRAANSVDEIADGLTAGKNVGRPVDEIADATANARKVPGAPETGTHMHHQTPREVLKQLPDDVANNPVVRGKRGVPNRRKISIPEHKRIHKGPGGGKANELTKQKIIDLGREPTADDVLRIRREVNQELNIIYEDGS
jgi:RHS repeat-associated protein